MVNVTERAKEKLRELLTTQSDDPSVGLRLDRASTGELGIFPDRGRADDQVVRAPGGGAVAGRPGHRPGDWRHDDRLR